MKPLARRCVAAAVSVLSLGVCSSFAYAADSKLDSVKAHVTAELHDADGKPVGTAHFTQKADGIGLMVKVEGLSEGVHGLHIHTTGLCDSPDFKTAGGHWNPLQTVHGMKNKAGHHMGDLPNIVVNAQGKGRVVTEIPGARISDGMMPLLDADGAALVIHAGPDDYLTDPSGNSGSRIACGVIQ